MRNPFTKISSPIKHLLCWLIPYGIVVGLQLTQEDHAEYNWFTQVTASFASMAAIAYSNLFLCRRYFFEKKYLYFLGVILLYSVYIVLVYFIVYPYEEKTIAGRAPTFFSTMFFYTVYFLLIFLLSFVFWLATAANKKNRELLAAQLLLQKFKTDKLDAENKFLQSQINPHFLYNTLNFFYAEALVVSPELADSIVLLSDTMRYSLELKENARGMTLLEDEVNHINNLVRINQYRFNNQLQIKFLISGELKAVCIAPLVLITFIENAFKHAELLTAKDPLVISLRVLKEEQVIKFSAENKIKKGSREISTGIGVENARRRLDYLYENQYELEIKQDEEYYRVSLTLPLFKDFAL
jgi:two-component system, LytTR family, sensor kinase